jgi:polyhydroxyalkanoate synthase subunit PhaC
MPENTDIQELLQEAAVSRPGLRPLPVHVGAVLAEYTKNPASYATIASDLTAMVAGIQKYQSQPFRRIRAPLAEVWRKGQAHVLFHPAAGAKKKSAIFLIPSMINRSPILDLLPDRSFLRWLAQQGYDVFMLDWGLPVKDTAVKDIEGIIRERLVPALEFAAKKSGGPVNTIGYCMGGTLLAAGAAVVPKLLRSAVFLASPWDFHAGDKVLASHIQSGTPQAMQMVAEKGCLPANWIQSVFAVVNADRTVKKFADFAKLDQDGEDARLFVAVEDWLNDGIDFPGGIARDCIEGWYGKNAPGRGEWKLGRKPVSPDRIRVPALVVASSTDRLVPMESSLALAGLLPKCDTLKPAIGHIGMMTGRKAVESVWKPVLSWLEKQP